MEKVMCAHGAFRCCVYGVQVWVLRLGFYAEHLLFSALYTCRQFDNQKPCALFSAKIGQ